MQAHFIPSGTRTKRSFFRQSEKEPRPTHSGPQGKSALSVQRVDWTSDHCHWQLNSVTVQFVATWFSIVGSDTVSKFHRGVMRGDPEADQQFTLVISVLLNPCVLSLPWRALKHRSLMRLQIRPFRLPGAVRLRPGTLTLHTSTTSPCSPTRPSTLSDALFLCSVSFVGNFDCPLVSLQEKPRLQWMLLALVLVLYAWLSGTRMRAVSNA